jgi:hypothetical protein
LEAQLELLLSPVLDMVQRSNMNLLVRTMSDGFCPIALCHGHLHLIDQLPELVII